MELEKKMKWGSSGPCTQSWWKEKHWVQPSQMGISEEKNYVNKLESTRRAESQAEWGKLPNNFLLISFYTVYRKSFTFMIKTKGKPQRIKSINSLMRYQCSVARSKFLWKLFPLQLDVQDLLCQPKLLARCGQFKKAVTKQEQFAHVWQAITQGNPTFKQGGKTHTPHTYQNTCQLTAQPARKYWHLFKRTCPHKQNRMPRIKGRPKV